MSEFKIQLLSGCRVVFGMVPMSEMSMLLHGYSERAVMSHSLADLMGASFVIGEPEDIEHLKNSNPPVSIERLFEGATAEPNHGREVADWLRYGERGASSNALCKRIFGIPSDAGIAHPLDPDDFRRCRLFLSATSSEDKIHLMKNVSPEWRRLAKRWREISQLFEEEAALGKHAPKTYALMKRVLYI